MASNSGLAGIGEDCGVKIPLLEGRIDFRSGRADWGGFLGLSSLGDGDLCLPRPWLGLAGGSSNASSSKSGDDGGES